ncbi:rhodanese-like domain-containing protein [Enterococcus plantarum]|uniref:rhodanese-like domain-containing protein n=1 Tax=Enterococcus plantarum TaxID=1077675 RepID=UPI001A8DBAEA|nr:rhodanese-like domain-containing protein [Enterococcus plantarum]
MPLWVFKGECTFSFFNKNSINTREFQQKLTKGTELIDVREKAKFTLGHIPGAKNIPLSKLSSYTKRAHGPVHVICQSGMRSRQAVKRLKNNGIGALNVRGGMNSWRGETRGGKL